MVLLTQILFTMNDVIFMSYNGSWDPFLRIVMSISGKMRDEL